MSQSMRVITLRVLNRFGCPHRLGPGGGWGPQVCSCNHPNQMHDPDADPWCPSEANSRDDDPTPRTTPFPPGCPLRDGEMITRPR